MTYGTMNKKAKWRATDATGSHVTNAIAIGLTRYDGT